ncbi:MAG: aquaporin [Bifidobacteriaceae bacterium]|nr:aquaporin [Bifidobacteriaceae bacterium]
MAETKASDEKLDDEKVQDEAVVPEFIEDEDATIDTALGEMGMSIEELAESGFDTIQVLDENDDVDIIDGIDDDFVQHPLWQRVLAEFAGTAIFLFAVYLNAVYSKLTFNDAAPLQTVFTIFLAYTAVKLAFGGISGGHFNPAISIAAAVAKKINALEGILYSVAQIAGGLFSILLLLLVLPQPVAEIPALTTKVYLGFAANGYGSASPNAVFDTIAGSQTPSLGSLLTYSPISLAIIELLATALIVFASLTVAKSISSNVIKALGAGIAYAIGTYIALPITSAGLNPARSFVIAFFANNGSPTDVSTSNIMQLWLYALVPICAGLIVGLCYSIFDYLKERPLAALNDDSLISDDTNLKQSNIPLFTDMEFDEKGEEFANNLAAEVAENETETAKDVATNEVLEEKKE